MSLIVALPHMLRTMKSAGSQTLDLLTVCGQLFLQCSIAKSFASVS